MKNFIRTAAMKTLLFILCVVLLCAFAAGILSLFVYLDEEIPFYTGTMEDVVYMDDDPFVMDLLYIAYQLRYAVYYIVPGCLLLLVFCFIALMNAAGKRPHTEDVFPGPASRIPTDILTALVVLLDIGIVYTFMTFAKGLDELPMIVAGVFTAVLLAVLLIAWCVWISVKVKNRTLFSSCILVRLFRYFAGAFRSIPMVWRTAAVIAVISVIELFILLEYVFQDELFLFWLLEKLILVPMILYTSVSLKRLAKGGEALAGGELAYQTDTKGMFGPFKKHGENLNSIGEGLSIALEDKLKSERMKTELITNVTHDIKTPLTSVINYAGLIGAEECENPKIKEYSEVLERQSQKLKRLVEDLIEASKASTGDLDVELSECDASVFVNQASGEYEEKLKQADLTLVVKQAGEELRIMADGRRMWRVFDNLMNNICKYAQPGTRVYLSLEKEEGHAVISFKNTSREELDLSPEELMERFTRGDRSRNTEGNGLGLSIARSMAELQGGKLNLSIDGDLFKAVLSFPLV